MKASEVLQQKFLSGWPESWKIFEDSCKYTVENNLDFIKGILLNRESKIDYNNWQSIWQQLSKHLEGLGYTNMISSLTEPFFTKKGHETGLVFTIFLSRASIDAYLKENEVWQKWVKANSRWEKEPPRPMYDKIRYLDIYKKKQ